MSAVPKAPVPTLDEVLALVAGHVEHGELDAAMATLACWFACLEHDATNAETARRFQRCAEAAGVIAAQWTMLHQTAVADLERRLETAVAAWVLCEECGAWYCLRHDAHVEDCPCPPFSEWVVDPRRTGGGPRPS